MSPGYEEVAKQTGWRILASTDVTFISRLTQSSVAHVSDQASKTSNRALITTDVTFTGVGEAAWVFAGADLEPSRTSMPSYRWNE